MPKLKKKKIKRKVELISNDNESDKEMEYDESVYEILHNFNTTTCLSFDIIPDNLGETRSFPLTAYFIAGTQAPHFNKNTLVAVKMENLHKTIKKNNHNESDASDSDTNEDQDSEKTKSKIPRFESVLINHEGGVNRLKVSQLSDNLLVCSTWAESGKVHIWDLKNAILALNDSKYLHKYRNIDRSQHTTKPIFTFNGHMEEGFAMGWSSILKGRIATGDNKSRIHLWNMLENGESWHVNQIPFTSHVKSVEDIQWSPSEADSDIAPWALLEAYRLEKFYAISEVFASCSSDRTIKIWDVRAKPTEACMLTALEAHDSDVNVISWNLREQYFLVSGGDDGVIRVWDLREFKSGKPMAIFKYHSGPITSIEWKPDESSVFAASSSDDKLSIWDLALEKDDLPPPPVDFKSSTLSLEDQSLDEIETLKEERKLAKAEYEELKELDSTIPPYLLFLHEGQREIKELHWHPQIPGLILDTALTGINIFKTINV